jgi:hypothetical protein
MQVEQRTVFSVNRLTVPVPSVREFQERYEALVPNLPLDQGETPRRSRSCVGRHGRAHKQVGSLRVLDLLPHR